jgi:isopenicillin N synthase-like dioxygenase
MPHKETASEFTPESYPPFPVHDDFPTIDLETISLQKLQNSDPAEHSRMFEACKDWGFFYLELPGAPHGEVIARDADNVARVAEQIFALPVEEKLKYSLTGKDLFG